MERKNSLIAAQALIILCTLALPFISIYCQEKPIRTVSTGRTAAGQRPVARRASVRRRPMARRTPSQTSQTPAIEPTTVEPAENIAQEAPVTAEDTEEAEINPTAAGTKQAQATTPTPNTWAGWYRSIAPLVLSSLYKNVSDSGIANFTKTVVKLFILRRDTLAEKEQLEKTMAMLSTKEARMYLREAEKMTDKDILELEATNLNKKSELEQKASISAILTTGAYIGMLNTVVPTIGGFMGLAIGMALQALMPRENS